MLSCCRQYHLIRTFWFIPSQCRSVQSLWKVKSITVIHFKFRLHIFFVILYKHSKNLHETNPYPFIPLIRSAMYFDNPLCYIIFLYTTNFWPYADLILKGMRRLSWTSLQESIHKFQLRLYPPHLYKMSLKEVIIMTPLMLTNQLT